MAFKRMENINNFLAAGAELGLDSHDSFQTVDLYELLMDGQVLCNLVNAISPGAVRKINTSSMAFKRMENINNFLAAGAELGLDSHDSFQTVDLYEAKNMLQV